MAGRRVRQTSATVDFDELREVFSGAGQDTRQWLTYGQVLPAPAASPDGNPTGTAGGPAIVQQNGVSFGPDGTPSPTADLLSAPRVSVMLWPSQVPVACRVSSLFGGGGGSLYVPFNAGDEVLVAVPFGDEASGCVIVGKLNNDSAKTPTTVAGVVCNDNAHTFLKSQYDALVELVGSLTMLVAKLTLTTQSGGDIALVPGGNLRCGSASASHTVPHGEAVVTDLNAIAKALNGIGAPVVITTTTSSKTLVD